MHRVGYTPIWDLVDVLIPMVKFTFDSPVYLKENTEYCFVLYSDSTKYTAYIARMGGTTLDGNRTVSKQPAGGVLFKSANYATWTAEQNEDMKFKINRCEFDTTSSGTLTLANKTLPVKTLGSNPIRTFSGSTIMSSWSGIILTSFTFTPIEFNQVANVLVLVS